MAEFPAIVRAIEKPLRKTQLVVMNMEPLATTLSRTRDSKEVLQSVEIDRPVLIRAAALKHEDIAVVVDPADYNLVQTEIVAHGGVTEDLRRRLAAKALAYAAAYDASIANWFREQTGIDFLEWAVISGKLIGHLRYGENPHQSAAFYRTGENRAGVAASKQVHGKSLSYNNINDTDAAYECVAEFDPNRAAACVIVKHSNPCGVAEGETLVDAYRSALRCDSTSAFGGIVAFNRVLDLDAALAITKIFTEVIIAPDASREAIAAISSKKDLRLLLAGGLPDPRAPGMVMKSVAGGFVVQSRDNAVVDDFQLKTVTKRQPTETELRDLRFAFRVVKHIKSNAIVYARDNATVGIGAGQMSRLDAARTAAVKAQDAAKQLGLEVPLSKGSVAASDAFFPFADGLLVAIEAGATAVIQPGGSVRDADVIQAADDHGIAMVFTGTRQFRH